MFPSTWLAPPVPILSSTADRRAFLRAAAILLVYGLAFAELHEVARLWGSGLFSLWFPGAGLRLAFLWRFGARFTPAAALSEFLGQIVTGEATFGNAPLLAITGMVSPCLVYGVVIHLVRSHLDRSRQSAGPSPLPFAIAALLGPIAACAAALPWAIPLASTSGLLDGRVLLTTLLVFMLGDLLGVLVLAPPLLWLADRIGRSRALLPPVNMALVTETLLVLAAGWGLVAIIAWNGLGLLLAPVLLATCWIGLRAGRLGAWCAIVLATAIVLPVTGGGTNESERLGLHMLLGCIAAVGYLAGSYSEAVALANGEIAKRDRILFQADRLKTLRGMSIAVIHEISQPLSTLSIEANNLVRASGGATPNMAEISEISQLIARKTDDLSSMVRRLRRFGERSADTIAAIPIQPICNDVAAIALPEAQAAQVGLDVEPAPDAWVIGHDIELRQALLNLLRNAIASAPRGSVVLVRHLLSAGRLSIAVENDQRAARRLGTGMGIGLIIARTIATAHGGSIREERPAGQRVRFILDLPLAGDPHG